METGTPVAQQKSSVQEHIDLMLGHGKGASLANKIVTENVPPPPAQVPAPAAVAPAAVPVIPPAAEPLAQTPAAEPTAVAVTEADQIIDTPLGKLTVKAPAQPAAAATKPSTFEDVFKSGDFTSALGMEINSPEDLQAKVPVFKEWRTQATQGAEHKKKHDALMGEFTSLPQEAKGFMLTVLESERNGDDSWKHMLVKTPVLDFKTPAEKVDTGLLLKTYYPGKFTEEQVSEPDNEAVQLAIEASRKFYVADQKSQTLKAQSQLEKAQQRRSAVSASLATSVEKVNSFLPVQVDDARVSEIKDLMESGSWMRLFQNEDGTFTEHAAASILMANHGAQTLGQVVQFAQNRAMSSATEVFVDKGAQAQVHGGGASHVDPNAKKAADNQQFLAQAMGQGQQPYYQNRPRP
jgi:hypothetical protein